MNKILSNMKRLFAILLLSALAWGARAQFAGPDKHVAREEGNTQTVTIGVADATADACYIWTGPHIVGNANQPVITVNPTSEIEDYMVKRISKNGIEEDMVMVFVEDTISILGVFPKYRCYSNDEAIDKSQFDIVMNPEGYENLVTVTPAVAQSEAATDGYIEITFSVTKNNHTSTKKTRVRVIDNDDSFSQSLPVGLLNIKRTLETMDKVYGAFQEAKSVTDKMEFLRHVPGSPCKWSDDPPASASSALDLRFRSLCCNDHTAVASLKVKLLQLSYGASFGCRVPFYGIPHVASCDLVCNFGASMSVGPVDGIISVNKSCADLCIPVTLGLTLNGGVGVSLGGDILTADLLLQGGGSAQLAWCLTSPNYLKLEASLSVVGTVTMCSFIEYSIEYPLASKSVKIEL